MRVVTVGEETVVEAVHVSTAGLPSPGGRRRVEPWGTSGVGLDVTWFHSGFASRLEGSGRCGLGGLDDSGKR